MSNVLEQLEIIAKSDEANYLEIAEMAIDRIKELQFAVLEAVYMLGITEETDIEDLSPGERRIRNAIWGNP